MLNEGAYKNTYNEKVRLSCLFEKAILSRCADCNQAQKLNIAEREAVACVAAEPRENCMVLQGLLHRNATFVLKLTQPGEPLPHAKEIRVQCGGLLGIQHQLDQDVNMVADVHALVSEAQRYFGDLQNVPYQEVIKEIAAYEGRRKR